MKKYLKLIALVLAVVIPAVALYFYYAFYQEDVNSGGRQCTILYLTGLQCPGCGGQRSLHYLLHGEFLTAIRYNVLFVFGLPFLVYLYYVLVRTYVLKDKKYKRESPFSVSFVWILMAVLLLFFILRNIPVAPFTYLAPPK